MDAQNVLICVKSTWPLTNPKQRKAEIARAAGILFTYRILLAFIHLYGEQNASN